jgi:hypothetical protein
MFSIFSAITLIIHVEALIHLFPSKMVKYCLYFHWFKTNEEYIFEAQIMQNAINLYCKN